MFEHRSQPLISTRKFIHRTLAYVGFASGMLLVSLLLGMVGYHLCARIDWIDSFYNASMILTGMGPGLDIDSLAPDLRDGVKIFAGMYALYSGVVFLAASGLALSPLLHRFFHKLHLDIKD